MNGTPRLLGGRYEVGELIGRGGMAEVHAGHDSRLGRPVAIKMLRSDLARDPTFLARFRREAQSAAGLNHPSIVAVYDSGEDHHTEAGGARSSIPFIVMERVEGKTLREMVNARRCLEPGEAAQITEGVLGALAYSHRMGIVHRDIKPANVMLTQGGDVKVMDFGIARAMADTNATMTQTQSVIGTAQYLSPEQAQGAHVDARSDLYSTGCLLFELLTGRTPFIGDSPVSIAYQHVGEAPPAPSTYQPDIPASLDAVVLHSLAKDREARYQSAAAFREDLQAARTGRPISTAARGTAAGAVLAGDATVRLGSATATQVVPTAATAAMAADAGRHANTASLPPIGRDPATEPRKRHAATYLLLTLAAIAALVLVGLAGKALLSRGSNAPTFAVPNVLKMTQKDATAKITGAGFNPVASTAASTEAKGTVVAQAPDPGERLPADSNVDFTVSSGPDTVQVPDVRNFTRASATEALKAIGLTVSEIQSVNDPSVDKGNVLETAPKAGTSVPVNSAVVLKIASGKVKVADVVGDNQSTAQQKLSDLQLRYHVKFEQSSIGKEGTVLRQSHAGQVVGVDTVIELVVAQAAPPSPTTTSPPSSPTSSPTTTTSAPG